SVGVEPRWLEVTELRIRGDATPYRTIAVISDLHPTGGNSLEREVIERLRERSPELIVLAGDMVDDPEDLEALRDFLTQLPPAEKSPCSATGNIGAESTVNNWRSSMRNTTSPCWLMTATAAS
ncbi:MAG: hypothetical protein EBZ91_08450, partial [Gammaproteobacteria bacterium]|nr:hypothetical protein [Gammaproteobacteria bacterium]